MDDGALRNDGESYRLHTENYSSSDIKLWQECLWKNFGLRANPQAHGNGHLLSIGASDGQAKKFSALIEPYIVEQVPSMKYKLYNYN